MIGVTKTATTTLHIALKEFVAVSRGIAALHQENMSM